MGEKRRVGNYSSGKEGPTRDRTELPPESGRKGGSKEQETREKRSEGGKAVGGYPEEGHSRQRTHTQEAPRGSQRGWG